MLLMLMLMPETFTEARASIFVVAGVTSVTLDSIWSCLRRYFTLRATGRTLCQQHQHMMCRRIRETKTVFHFCSYSRNLTI